MALNINLWNLGPGPSKPRRFASKTDATAIAQDRADYTNETTFLIAHDEPYGQVSYEVVDLAMWTDRVVSLHHPKNDEEEWD